MKSEQTIAQWVGVLFLLATLTYGVGSGMLGSVVETSGDLSKLVINAQPVHLGALFMLVNCLAVVAIGVLMFPILKRHSEIIALGYAVTRAIEGTLLAVGVVGLLSLIAVSKELNGGSGLEALGAMAVGFNGWAFQAAMLVLGVGSLFFCFLLYQTGLIPRPLALLGLVGYAALSVGAVLDLLGFSIGLVHFIPGGLFELLLPLWLFVYGFN